MSNNGIRDIYHAYSMLQSELWAVEPDELRLCVVACALFGETNVSHWLESGRYKKHLRDAAQENHALFCGTERIMAKIYELQQAGELKNIEGNDFFKFMVWKGKVLTAWREVLPENEDENDTLFIKLMEEKLHIGVWALYHLFKQLVHDSEVI